MLDAYLTDTVVLVRRTGTVTWGNRSETETSVKARVEWKNRMVRDFKGEQVVSSASVLLKSQTLNAGDRIKIDDIERPILSIGKPKSFADTMMMEVSIG